MGKGEVTVLSAEHSNMYQRGMVVDAVRGLRIDVILVFRGGKGKSPSGESQKALMG